MIRLFALLFLLTACAGAPQKALSPFDLGGFETAFVETGRTDDGWTVSHIVRTGTQYALVVYARRADGRAVNVASVSVPSGAFQHVQVGGVGGAMIKHTDDAMETASKSGFVAELCGALACYPVDVPAALYQQALWE